MAVHSELGPGFLEAIYHEALEREFNMQGMPFSKEKKLPVYYKKYKLKNYYLADFICYDSVIVEIKALRRLSGNEDAQLINYLKASGLNRGLLMNFGAKQLQGTSKNALRGIVRDGNGKVQCSVSFIFNHSRD